MRRRKELKSGYMNIVLVIAIVLVVMIASYFFVIKPHQQPQSITSASVVGFPTSQYKVPVGGTVTLTYTINTWNGRTWYWSDLDTYQYEYTVYDNITGGNPIAYGAPWRLIHDVTDSISLKMNKEGTFKFRLEEIVVTIPTGARMKGSVIPFTVIVGSGIAPTVTPTPVGYGGTATLEQPVAVQTSLVTSTPIPTTSSSINRYTSGTSSAPTPSTVTPELPSAYTVLPTSSATPVQVQQPILPPIPIPATTVTFIPPTPEPTQSQPSTPTSPRFEGVLAITGLIAVAYLVLRQKSKNQ